MLATRPSPDTPIRAREPAMLLLTFGAALPSADPTCVRLCKFCGVAPRAFAASVNDISPPAISSWCAAVKRADGASNG
jgi:hypothetical protein